MLGRLQSSVYCLTETVGKVYKLENAAHVSLIAYKFEDGSHKQVAMFNV